MRKCVTGSKLFQQHLCDFGAKDLWDFEALISYFKRSCSDENFKTVPKSLQKNAQMVYPQLIPFPEILLVLI